MANPQGLNAKLGLKEVSNWTDAYAAVDTLVPLITEGMQHNVERIDDDSLGFGGGRQPSKAGNEGNAGPLEFDLDYNNFDLIHKLIFGSQSTRTFAASNDENPVKAWLEINKGIFRERWGAAKIGKATWSGEARTGKVMLSTDWVSRTRATSVSGFPVLSLPGARNRILFQHLKFRIADQVDAIADGDRVEIARFTIEFDRAYKDDDYHTDASNPTKVLEPEPGDFRTVKIDIGFDRYTSQAAAIQAFRDADTALQMDFTFASGGETYVLQFPEVRVTDGGDVPIEGPAPLKVDFELRAYMPVASPMAVTTDMQAVFT